MNDDDKTSLENRVNSALDDSVEGLSVDVQRRLTSMRMDAARANAESSGFEFNRSWKFASAFSLAFAVTLSWNLWPTLEQNPIAGFAEISPFAEVLEEDLEMLDELEFVYWMAEESDSETATL